jgi:DNA-binding MarR family transcriptional regulator
VAGRLAKEIQQKKPFASTEEEALLNLARTFEVVQQRLSDALKPYQLTATQYNVLRILRGAGPDGVTCSQAGERMVNHDPDMTRLLDRLEARKLVERERSREDRRIVITRITKTGLELVNSLDEPMKALHRRQAGHIGKEKLQQLIDTLESLRSAPG